MITFAEPKFEDMCIDMHFHSTFSDGAASVQQILRRAKELGIGVAITDHNEIEGSLSACDQSDVTVVPAIEVKSQEGIDVLFYFNDPGDLKDFYYTEIEQQKKKYYHSTTTSVPLEKLHALSESYECLAVIAHPFGYTMRGKKDILSKHRESILKFHAIEAINGGNPRNKNTKAVELIKEHDKAYTGGSDGHSIYDLGRVVTHSKSNSLSGFLDDIRNKNCDVTGMETAFSKLGMLGNYARNRLTNVFKK